jgi:hypothetical protein
VVRQKLVGNSGGWYRELDWFLLGVDSCGAESRVMALFQRNVVESQDSQSWEGMLVGKKEKCLKRWGSDLDEMAVRWVEQTSERTEREWKQYSRSSAAKKG